MSLKEVLQSLKRIKDICVTLDKECGENAVEHCSKLYCLVENYTIKKKTDSAKQTTLKNYFSKVQSLPMCLNISNFTVNIL